MNFKEVLIRLVAYTKPYVYDNNISLLELTRKLYRIVNELCIALQDLNADYEKFKEDVNTEIESFESDMTSDLQALREYVDNYFSSLNIEEAVKNVLEEMTQDGTLEELLNETVLANINTHLTNLDSSVSNLTTRVGNLETDNTTNKSNIGTLNNLTTTDKTSLVNAINEIDSNADNNSSNIGTMNSLNTTDKTSLVNAINEVDSNTDNNTSNIGTMNSLNTTDKESLVGAINEVNTKLGDLSNLDTTDKTNLVSAINENKTFIDYMTLTDFRDLTEKIVPSGSYNGEMNVALNKLGTAGKIYANFSVSNPNSPAYVTFTNTGIQNITSDITISDVGIVQNTSNKNIDFVKMTIKPAQGSETSARLEIRCPVYGNNNYRVFIFPCIYFFKDFGDTD